MAGPGTDAAEGDGSRSADPSSRLTGWRVPSVVATQSGLPGAWIDPHPPPPLPDATQPATELPESREPDETAAFGQPTALRHGPRWSLRRRRRRPPVPERTVMSAAERTVDVSRGEVDLDLVALDEEEWAWTDHALAALEEPDDPEAWLPGHALIGSPELSPAATGPWSELTEALETDDGDAPPTADRDQPTELDLEAEFWN